MLHLGQRREEEVAHVGVVGDRAGQQHPDRRGEADPGEQHAQHATDDREAPHDGEPRDDGPAGEGAGRTDRVDERRQHEHEDDAAEHEAHGSCGRVEHECRGDRPEDERAEGPDARDHHGGAVAHEEGHHDEGHGHGHGDHRDAEEPHDGEAPQHDQDRPRREVDRSPGRHGGTIGPLGDRGAHHALSARRLRTKVATVSRAVAAASAP
ncbi:MAG: hypothetical protein EON52_12065 [Actinomycetales bacterium]|nr:MAG: hypothetical protein EON52_12065 [Actinomycetales bacterium]